MKYNVPSYHESSSSATGTAGNLVSIEAGLVKTFFMTNDRDQNSAASEMPATLTVTYAAIVACVIETRTVSRPARPCMQHCSGPPVGLSSLAGTRAQVAASRGRVLVSIH